MIDPTITTYNDLQPGDIINYDITLKNGTLKNISELVAYKDNTKVKLIRIDITWYCTKEYYKQLLNVIIVKD